MYFGFTNSLEYCEEYLFLVSCKTIFSKTYNEYLKIFGLIHRRLEHYNTKEFITILQLFEPIAIVDHSYDLIWDN